MTITREKLEQWVKEGAALEDALNYSPSIGGYAYAKWKRQHAVLLSKICICGVVSGGHVVHGPECPFAAR